jgi:hypothetical protein
VAASDWGQLPWQANWPVRTDFGHLVAVLDLHFLGTMGKWLPILALALATGACATGDDEPLDDSGFESVGDETSADLVGDIQWQVRETPELLELDVPVGDKVEYGECERVEPEDDSTDIEIHCTMPWAEVAWYVIPKDVIAAGLDRGASKLTAPFVAPERTLRSSIHHVSAEGKRTKLISNPMLFDGDSIDADIDEAADHYIYVARGRSLAPLWGTGTVSYSIRATFE